VNKGRLYTPLRGVRAPLEAILARLGGEPAPRVARACTLVLKGGPMQMMH
jgi:hypothetical protein